MHGKKNVIIISIMVVLFVFVSLPVFGGGEKDSKVKKFEDVKEWEEYAGLGESRPVEDDWAEIERKAIEEGEVTIYCNSGSIFEAARTFYNKYGIKAQPYDIATGSLYDKLGREQRAGVFNADVILSSGTHTMNNEFVRRGGAYRFVPTEIEPLLLDAVKGELLGIQRLGGKAVAYNSEVYDKPPIDSWWDLTRPRWKNKLTMKDPMQGGSEIGLMVMFIRHSDEMAELYKREFGEEITLTGTENAGYEFIKRLIGNGLILTASGTPAAISVGTKGQTDPPLGIISPSKMKYREVNNLDFEIAWDLEPVGSYVSLQALSIPKFAPNPNAAKLFIKWVYGNENGGDGLKPWYLTGTWPARKDIPLPPDQPNLDDIKTWYEDADFVYDNIIEFQDFWIQHQSQ